MSEVVGGKAHLTQITASLRQNPAFRRNSDDGEKTPDLLTECPHYANTYNWGLCLAREKAKFASGIENYDA
mgnify:CR=1 FL=1